MGSLERRERERQDTRTRILDAARDLFVRHGLDKVTMRAIADRIEYTPTAIYHHFRDKQALITELVHHDFRALAGAFRQIGRIEDPVERIDRLGAAYVRFGLEHPGHYRFLFMTDHPDVEGKPERGNPEEDAYAMLHQAVAEAIAAKRFRPEYRDEHQVSQMCWAAMHGIVSLHLNFCNDDWIEWRDAAETARRMSQAMMRGMER